MPLYRNGVAVHHVLVGGYWVLRPIPIEQAPPKPNKADAAFHAAVARLDASRKDRRNG